MEESGGEHGGGAGGERRGKVLRAAGAARGDDRHVHPGGGRGQELAVEALAGAVAVDAGQQELARAALDACGNPLQGVEPGRSAVRPASRPPRRGSFGAARVRRRTSTDSTTH